MPVNPLLLTILITGSGAVKNSWAPVCKALHLPHLSKPLTNNGANTFLAKIVYDRRFFYNLGTDPIAKDSSDRTMQNIKNFICRELITAKQNNDIEIQAEFNDIMDKIVMPDTKALLSITTNWDLVIDEAIESFPKFSGRSRKPITLHIHGSIKEPSGLYLPTEVIQEPYRTDLEIEFFERLNLNIMTSLMVAKKIVIYGLSISALDAELLQVINACFEDINSNLTEIIVIDKNPCDVVEKLQLINNTSKLVSITGYTPNDLINPAKC